MGDTSTFGNPIGDVLGALGVTVDDGSAPEPDPTPTPGPTATPTPTPTATPEPTPTATPPPGSFTLSTTGYKVKGLQKADLTWSGANTSNADVSRNGVLVVTTVNDGFYTDDINNRGKGTYLYKVCEEGTSTCSNETAVTFG